MRTVISIVSRLARMLPCALAFAACIPGFEDDQTLVTDVRVLAVRSEPAEPRPFDTVTLHALLAAPQAAGSNAPLRWSLCTARKALTELGPVAPECIADFGKKRSDALQPLGEGLQVQARIGGDVCRNFGPLAPAPQPGSSVSGRPVDPDSTGGFYQPVVLGAGAPTLAAIRIACGAANLPREAAIVFNQGYRPNENPKLQALHVKRLGGERDGASDALELIAPDAAALSLRAGAQLELHASVPRCPDAPVCGDGLCSAGENASACAEDCREAPVGCAGAEPYLRADLAARSVVTEVEELRIAWLSTAGWFAIAQTGTDATNRSTENLWTAPDAPQAVTLWIVLRDDRGGVDFRQVHIEVTR